MKSFRTRLILANTLVIALVSSLVGGSLAWLNLSRMAAGIDRELADRSRNATRVRGPGSGGPGNPMGGPGGFGGPGPRGPERGQGGPRNPFNDPIGQIRRPRILFPDGKPAGPNDDVPFDLAAISAAKHGPLYSETTYEGEPVRVYTLPYRGPDGEERIVQVARELRDYHELRRVQGMALIIVLPLALIGAAAAGVLLSRSALGPIAALREAIMKFTAGDRSHRIPVQGDDEFADLTRQYNAMADATDGAFRAQTEAYAALEQSYEQQRRFVADASHELRTPLTRIQLLAANALEDSDSERREALVAIESTTQGLGQLVRQLLELARADADQLHLRREQLDLRAWLADLIRDDRGTPPLEIILAEEPVMASIDAGLMARVIANLVDNSRRHTPANGQITLEVLPGPTLRIHDTGSGIAEEHLPHVFERFYRVDSARGEDTGGTGLGLAIVDEIVRKHGGTVEITSELGRGTSVTLRLPEPATS